MLRSLFGRLSNPNRVKAIKMKPNRLVMLPDGTYIRKDAVLVARTWHIPNRNSSPHCVSLRTLTETVELYFDSHDAAREWLAVFVQESNDEIEIKA